MMTPSMGAAARRGLAILVWMMMMWASASAWAQDENQARARELNNRGSAAFELGSYDEAIARFSEAYKTYPDARILFNLAQAYRKQKNNERALELYRTFLRNLPDAPNRKDVEELIAELEGIVARQRITDSKPPLGVAATGPDEPLRTVSKIVEPRPWYQNATGWVLTGSGVALVGTGVGFLISASNLESNLAGVPEDQRPGIRSDASTRRTIGAIATTVGGLALAGGIVLFVVSPRTVTREIVPIKDLKVSLRSNGIGISGSF